MSTFYCTSELVFPPDLLHLFRFGCFHQMVSQMMLEKTENSSIAALNSMRRRETWCPGEVSEIPQTGWSFLLLLWSMLRPFFLICPGGNGLNIGFSGIKRGSGGELPSPPPSGSKCSKADDGLLLPALSQDEAAYGAEGVSYFSSFLKLSN